jgi:regulator of protease activity HflC (stomatin/prohibitin superfamily)
MQKRWVVAVFALILIVAFVLARRVGAVRAGLLGFFATVAAVLAFHTVRVPECAALVVRSTAHDGVRRVIQGPAVALLVPFLEKAGPRVDTSYRIARVDVEDVLQSDLQPAILSFSAEVGWKLAPQAVPISQLGDLLPLLLGNPRVIIDSPADYCLRGQIARTTISDLCNGGFVGLERHLERSLRHSLKGLGIAIVDVKLLVSPPSGLRQMLHQAERQRVGIALQAEQIEALLARMTGHSKEAESLAVLELARSLGHNAQAWIGLDANSLIGGRANGSSRPLSHMLAQPLPFRFDSTSDPARQGEE